MTQLFSRRAVMASLASCMGAAACANAPDTSLRPILRPDELAKRNAKKAQFLIEEAKLGGQVGYAVIDLKSGRIVEARDSEVGLPPASVAKAVTALYALDTLGGGHRFVTSVIAPGGVSGGVVNGDLILAGGGDPTLDTDMLAALASKLKAAGVREVRGQLRPWGGALPKVAEIDSEQRDYVAYNPTVSGLNLNFNRVHFEWKRGGSGYTTTMDARSGSYRPSVRSARMSVASRKSPLYTYKDGGSHDSWTVAGGALGSGGSRWLPHRKPEIYAAEVFAYFAKAQGISLSVGDPVRSAPNGATLASVSSAPLRDILQDMLKFSNNLTAEVVGLSATTKRKGRATSLKASAQEMTVWAGQALGMQGARFVDHSGLGAASRVPAVSMAQAMARAYGKNELRPILKPFTMRHSNGKLNKEHPIKVQAKTGTLYFTSTLSGYMTAPDGTELAFAIFTVNEQRRAAINRNSDATPEGSGSWNKRSKTLQSRLIERWGTVYSG